MRLLLRDDNRTAHTPAARPGRGRLLRRQTARTNRRGRLPARALCRIGRAPPARRRRPQPDGRTDRDLRRSSPRYRRRIRDRHRGTPQCNRDRNTRPAPLHHRPPATHRRVRPRPLATSRRAPNPRSQTGTPSLASCRATHRTAAASRLRIKGTRYDYAGQDPINGYDLSGELPNPCAGKGSLPSCHTQHTAHISLASLAHGAVKYGPVVLSVAAGVACTAATEGACAPLAYAAISAAVGRSAYDNGIVSNRPTNVSAFSVDVGVSLATFGAGKAVEPLQHLHHSRFV